MCRGGTSRSWRGGVGRTVSSERLLYPAALGLQACRSDVVCAKVYLERGKDHLEDFAPELAMVTKFCGHPAHQRDGHVGRVFQMGPVPPRPPNQIEPVVLGPALGGEADNALPAHA